MSSVNYASRQAAREELPMQLTPGNYRLRLRGEAARAALRCVEDSGPDMAEIRWDGTTLDPDEVIVYARSCSLRLHNTSDREAVLIVEHDAWGTQGASAALVTSFQEFRNLFSSEVLAPGMGVSIRNMTVLFSDLKGSTRMYSDIGDSLAYARVRDHFDVLVAIIQRHRGALVKTIGDAVMAVFLSAEDGFEAALEMLDRYGIAQRALPKPAATVYQAWPASWTMPGDQRQRQSRLLRHDSQHGRTRAGREPWR